MFVVVVNFLPSFSLQFFFVSSERDIHRTTSPTSFRHWICQKHLLQWLTSSKSHSRSLYSGLGSNSDRNGIYSSLTLVISDSIFFVYHLHGALAKMRARVTRDGVICTKNSPVGINGRGIQLGSPTLIMAPDMIDFSYLTEPLYFWCCRRRRLEAGCWETGFRSRKNSFSWQPHPEPSSGSDWLYRKSASFDCSRSLWSFVWLWASCYSRHIVKKSKKGVVSCGWEKVFLISSAFGPLS